MTLEEQFEEVRASGLCNMHDRRCVREYAEIAQFDELLAVTRSRDEYGALLWNYGKGDTL